MSRKVCPDYAKDYKNEFLFIKGINKCFQYYVKIIINRQYTNLDSRVPRINKYLNAYGRRINKKIKIEACDIKNSIVLIRLLNNIKENFERYVGSSETDVNDTNFYHPGIINLIRCVLRLHSKININGYYDDSDYTDGPYYPVGF